jgi:hypothetical protein
MTRPDSPADDILAAEIRTPRAEVSKMFHITVLECPLLSPIVVANARYQQAQ